MKTRFLLVAVAVALLAFNACSRAEDHPMKTDVKAEQEAAANFTLTTLSGETIELQQTLKEKQVVLDFWASWCPYCVKIMPQLDEFYQKNKDKVVLIGVNINESKEKVAAYVQENGISYSMALDTDGSLAKLYKVRGIPTLVVIGQDNKVAYYGHSFDQMIKEVNF